MSYKLLSTCTDSLDATVLPLLNLSFVTNKQSLSLKTFLGATFSTEATLQLLIIAIMSYLCGSRFSSMKVLYVDYDQGSVGESVAIAYNGLKGPSVPSLIQQSEQIYPTQQHIQQAVCRGEL